MWSGLYRAGRQLAATGDTATALDNYSKSLHLIQGLASADPADIGHQRWLALTHLSLGELFAKLDQSTRARDEYRKAISVTEQLWSDDPQRIETLRDLAREYQSLGVSFEQTNELSPALEFMSKAQSLAEQSAANDPQNGRIAHRLAKIYADVGEVHRKLAGERNLPQPIRTTNLRTARECYERSLQIWRELKQRDRVMPPDNAKPDDVARQLAECDALLSRPVS